MAAGEKLDLLVTGLSSKVTTVQEVWYLVGSVEGINKKELLLECPVEAEFVDPKLEMSCSTMEFQFDYGPYSELYKLTGNSTNNMDNWFWVTHSFKDMCRSRVQLCVAGVYRHKRNSLIKAIYY